MKVRSHLKKNKSGKISIVKEFERKDKVSLIKNFFKNNNKIKDNKGNISKLKTKTIKFVIKDLGIKDPVKIKKLSTMIYEKINGTSHLDNQEILKPKEEIESRYKYYFGQGSIDHLINSSKDIREGDTFYNQKIKYNEPWKETIKRKNIKIMQIGKLLTQEDHNSKFLVKTMEPIENGKKLKIKTQLLDNKSVYKILKNNTEN